MARAVKWNSEPVPSHMVVELDSEAETLPTLPTHKRLLLCCLQVNMLDEGSLLTKAVTTIGAAEGMLTHLCEFSGVVSASTNPPKPRCAGIDVGVQPIMYSLVSPQQRPDCKALATLPTDIWLLLRVDLLVLNEAGACTEG